MFLKLNNKYWRLKKKSQAEDLYKKRVFGINNAKNIEKNFEKLKFIFNKKLAKVGIEELDNDFIDDVDLLDIYFELTMRNEKDVKEYFFDWDEEFAGQEFKPVVYFNSNKLRKLRKLRKFKLNFGFGTLILADAVEDRITDIVIEYYISFQKAYFYDWDNRFGLDWYTYPLLENFTAITRLAEIDFYLIYLTKKRMESYNSKLIFNVERIKDAGWTVWEFDMLKLPGISFSTRRIFMTLDRFGQHYFYNLIEKHFIRRIIAHWTFRLIAFLLEQDWRKSIKWGRPLYKNVYIYSCKYWGYSDIIKKNFVRDERYYFRKLKSYTRRTIEFWLDDFEESYYILLPGILFVDEFIFQFSDRVKTGFLYKNLLNINALIKFRKLLKKTKKKKVLKKKHKESYSLNDFYEFFLNTFIEGYYLTGYAIVKLANTAIYVIRIFVDDQLIISFKNESKKLRTYFTPELNNLYLYIKKLFKK